MSKLSPAELAELAALRAHRTGYERFADFIKRFAPRYWPIPPHLQPLVDLIERSRHEQVRALVSMPPRHGKTTTFMLGLIWRVMLDPACRNFYVSFGSHLSDPVGRQVRQMATALGIPLDRSSSTIDDWNTVYGGGLRSTSLGGAITGAGCNGGIILVDDLIKGWKAAMSDQQRDEAFQYIKSDVMSRLEGGGSIIICGTRWHEDDPIGRLMIDGLGEQWQVINLPAVGDENGNPLDERIYPDRARPLWLDVDARQTNSVPAAMEWYRKIRARGEREWWALYQGVPRSADQVMFNNTPGRFQMPLKWIGKRGALILDPAASVKTTGDFSALGAFAMDGYAEESRMYVAEAAKFHKTIPDVAREARAWQKRYKLLLGVEAVGGFKAIPQMLRETEKGIALVEITPLGDKKTRAIPVSGAWNNGRVLVPMGIDEESRIVTNTDWVDDFVRVVHRFTGVDGQEDDYVDILAHGWNLLYRERKADRTRGYHAPAF